MSEISPIKKELKQQFCEFRVVSNFKMKSGDRPLKFAIFTNFRGQIILFRNQGHSPSL